MKYFQKLTILAAILLMPNIACTNEAKQQPEKTEEVAAQPQETIETVDLAENKDVNVKVYNITSMMKVVPDKAVDFTWEENGKTMSFKELTKGKVVFLNFWGTWCPPCRAEIPDIIELSKDLADKDFIVIGMATERPNENNPMKKVIDFARDKGIEYHLFITDNQIRQAYGGIQYVPTTFIIDKNGDIVETINGMRSKAEFLTAINKVLK